MLGNPPGLGGRGRVSVARLIDEVGPVLRGQAVGKGTHVLRTASPPMQKEQGGGIVGAMNLDVQVAVRHKTEGSTRESAAKGFRETISIWRRSRGRLKGSVFWPGARFPHANHHGSRACPHRREGGVPSGIRSVIKCTSVYPAEDRVLKKSLQSEGVRDVRAPVLLRQ